MKTSTILNYIVLLVTVSLLIYVFFKNKTHTVQEQFFVEDSDKLRFLDKLYSMAPEDDKKAKQNGIDEFSNETIEDLSAIEKNLELYVSSYSKDSYEGKGTQLLNISPNKDKVNVISIQGKMLTRDFEFEQEPTWNPEKGLFLGKNALVGPLSLNLGVSGNAEFTVFIACKHDELDMTQTSIELFKIFANTTNNNGLSLQLYELESGIVPVGKMRIMFAGVTYESTEKILLDKNNLYVYVITKTPSILSLKVLTDANETVHEILMERIQNQECLLSNKEMKINTGKNWNAYFKCFGIFKTAIGDTELRLLQEHIVEQEKSLEKSIIEYKKRIRMLKSTIEHMKKCPFNDATCEICDRTADWSDATTILLAQKDCKKAIETFCKQNPKHPRCYCWDEKNPLYDTQNCYNVRRFIGQDSIGRLTKEELQQLKQQYSLVEEKSCTKPETITNVQPQKVHQGELQTLGIHMNHIRQQDEKNDSIDNKKCPNPKPLPKPLPEPQAPRKCKHNKKQKKKHDSGSDSDSDLEELEELEFKTEDRKKTVFGRLVSWF